MAAGDGFKQVPFGFDKNEVNSYISDLRKKMSALEADMRKNDEKTRAAEKLAEEADDRIKAAAAENEKKIEELSAQLEEERSTTDRQRIEIRNLKDRIDAEKKKMTDMLKNGKGVSAEATRAFNEVIEKANEESASIIEKANSKAADIIAAAKQQQNEITTRTNAFLRQLREQLEMMNSGYNAVNKSAAELLGTEPAAAVELPEVQPVAVPVIEAPKAEEKTEPVSIDIPEPQPEPEEEIQPEPEPAPEVVAEPEPEPEPVAEPEPEPEQAEDISDDLFSNDWSGNEMAEAVAEAEKKAAADAGKDIPLVNPDSEDNMFGSDLFSMDDHSDDMNGFDMDNHEEQESIVDKVEPLDVTDHAEASYDKDFNKDLLSQTMTSSSLGDDADDELLAAVKAAEEAFAVQPTDVSEIDMDEQAGGSAAAPAESEEDELMRALREAEEALNSVKESADFGSIDTEQEAPSAEAEDPWADLQKQLEAMESANGAGSAVVYDEPEPVQQEEPVAAPPSADDSSIWDFGGDSGGSDDDMSSDFGGFGGF